MSVTGLLNYLSTAITTHLIGIIILSSLHNLFLMSQIVVHQYVLKNFPHISALTRVHLFQAGLLPDNILSTFLVVLLFQTKMVPAPGFSLPSRGMDVTIFSVRSSATLLLEGHLQNYMYLIVCFTGKFVSK